MPTRSRSKSSIEAGGVGRPEFFWAAIVFFAALFLYTWTLAPTVTLVDSGELILAAHSLGVAHPPGFPLWVMLAHLVSLAPFGTVAARINFSSAVFAAFASAILTLIVAEVSVTANALQNSRQRGRGNTGQVLKSPSREKTGTVAHGDRFLVVAPALAAGFLVAFSRTLWSYATVTEVYALNTLLLLLIFFLMLRWRRRVMATKTFSLTDAKAVERRRVADDSLLYVAALLFGLALGVHHVTIALTLPALGLIVYRTEGWAFFKGRRLAFAALISSAAFVAAYLYLPLAASRAPIINWGDPHSAKAVWWHITGRQYQAFLSFTPSTIAEQFVAFTKILFREFGFAWLPVGIALALTGLASAFKRERTIFWFLVLIVASNLAYTLSYDIAEDKDAYCLPVFIAFAIAAGMGVRELIQFLFLAWSARPARVLLVTIAGLFLTMSLTLAANWPYNNRRRCFIAHDYVGNILKAIKPNGLLLTLDWQVASPFLYVQEIEGRRRDVKVLDINLMRRSWYFGYLRQTHPDLVDRSRGQIDSYVDELKQWEDNPAAYTNNPALTSRIAGKFVAMIQACVQHENEIGPVYITHEVLTASDRDVAVRVFLTTNYALVPEGLVFRLGIDSAVFHEPGEVGWQTRGLNDGTLKFEPGDVVTNKVLPAYTTMLINRGRYLAFFSQHERAIVAFRQALALNPNLDLARQGLNESLAKSPNP